MLNNFTLLITGCMRPDLNVPFLKVSNYDERKKQYIESISFYLFHTRIKNIVYCDNSSAELPEEFNINANISSKNFEWLSFAGDNSKAVDKGKGYGEGEIIEYALRHSKLLQESNYFIKVTGRVIVKNIDFLIRYMINDRLYFCRNSVDNVDTKLYGIPINIYKNSFLNLFQEVDDNNGQYLENLFSDEIANEHINIDSFIVFPDIRGVSGSTGQSYMMPLYGRIVRTIKSYLQRKTVWKRHS